MFILDNILSEVFQLKPIQCKLSYKRLSDAQGFSFGISMRTKRVSNYCALCNLKMV